MSLKVVHIGDLHLGGEYPEKAAASIDYILQSIADPASPAFQPDLVVCTGDSTERPLRTDSEHLTPLLQLINTIEAPVVFLQGTFPTHEPIGFLRNLERANKYGITVMDEPGVFITPLNGLPCRGQASDQKIALAGFPAFSRASLQAWSASQSHPEYFETPGEQIREVLAYITSEWEAFQGPKILLGHWTVNGCTTATGQVLLGSDIAIGLDDLGATGANAVLLGHIHKVQSWGVGPTPTLVTYCGSSYPCNWGELDEKSFSVLEFNEKNGTVESLVRLRFPHKPMLKVSAAFDGTQVEGEWKPLISMDTEAFPPPDTVTNAGTDWSKFEIKCCYSVVKEIAAQVGDMYVRSIFQRHGIELAAVERTILAGDTERIQAIAEKRTTRDQYLAVCAAKGKEPREGALAKADLIDELGVGR